MKYLIALCLIIPLAGVSQEIRTNTVDGFTGQRTIETSVISLKTAYTTGMGLYLSSTGPHYLVNLVGYGTGFGAIQNTDFLYFLMDDNKILTAASIGDQPANDGRGTKIYQHHYLFRFKDLKDLATKNAVLLRVTTATGNPDITLSKLNTKEIKKWQLYL